MLWSPGEDKLLFAIIHEFGENWALLADVLGSSSSLQGVCRSRLQCKERSKEIKVRNTGHPLLFSSRLTSFNPV